MKIIVHQAICGQVSDGGFGCINSTLNDSALAKSIGFKSDLQDPYGDVPWFPAIRGFLLNEHFLFIKTFADKSPEARPGRNFSHVLVINKKDLSALTNLQVLFQYFLPKVDKTYVLEPISIDSGAKQIVILEENLNKRFNKVIHGIHKIGDYKNTLIWVGQDDYELAISKLWQVLTIDQKHELNLGINFNVDAIKKDKLNFVTVPDTVENKFLKTEYCVIRKADVHELKEFSEKFLAGDESASEKIQDFSETIESKKLNISEIEIASKVISTFENLDETKDFRKLLTLANVTATFSPDCNKGKEFKDKLIKSIIATFNVTPAEDFYLLRMFKTNSFLNSQKEIETAIADWIETNTVNEALSKKANVISYLKLCFNEQEQNWLSKSSIKKVNGIFAKITKEKVTIIYDWFTQFNDLFKKISVGANKENDVLFSDGLAKSYTIEQLKSLTNLAEANNWFTMLAKLYRRQHKFKEAVNMFLKINSDNKNTTGFDELLANISEQEIVQVSIDENEIRLINISARLCNKNSLLLSQLDAKQYPWLKIWSQTIKLGNKLEDGIKDIQLKIYEILNLLLGGGSVDEILLDKIAESSYSSILKHPQRKLLWNKFTNKQKQPILNATFSDLVGSVVNNGWSLQNTDIKDEIMRHENLSYILKMSSTHNVLWLFNNTYGLGEGKLIEFLNSRSESLSSSDCSELGLIINKGRYSSAFNLINSSLISKNSNLNQTINITADTFKKYEWGGFFKGYTVKTPKKNYNNQRKTKILFLSANPVSTTRLRVDAEVSRVDEALKSSQFRSRFDLENKGAVRLDTFSTLILENDPAIIHFSGHADKEGIALEDREGQTKVLANNAIDEIFKLFKNRVKCVVLNACYSENQAKIISKHGIYVVGMNDEINDDVAINFSVGFYLGIVNGKDPVFSYNFARTKILAENTSSSSIPVLWYNGAKISTEESLSKPKQDAVKKKASEKQTKKAKKNE